ncbi:hypothetical protein KC19_4G018600 [Ceratodon purpureus]|uniref:Glycosyltransferases n=1 Tax=Ceratodon purpureus TaxID=3225 RepID=A0A8T0I5U1_CERPU|nr:hypothetical protein KC19_4G018600 [Ceratodon purpureus]
MASLRRSLSPQIRDCRASSSGKSEHNPFQQLNASVPASLGARALSQAQSLLLWPLRVFAMAESFGRGATKMSSWKKLLIQFGVCFVIGLFLGWFTPPKWQLFVPDSLAVEGKTAEADLFGSSRVANALTETKTASSLGSQAREVISVDEVSGFRASLEVPLEPRKLLIVVTPTYTRPFKAYYLTRLAHTLKLVPPPLLWIVVEMHAQSLETAALLRETGIMYRHLVCDKNLTNVKDRGTYQRNTAMAHIEEHQLDGIVYFADDDNMYTLELFEQMRTIKRFGTWLVGMLAPGKSRPILEGPVCKDEKVVGWHTNEKSKRLRRFHVDMSGFAFNSTILWDPRRWKRPTLEPIRQLDTIKEGFQETTFIEQLVPDESVMEGRPPGCLKVMVWHLHLEAPKGFAYPAGWTLTTPLQANIPLRRDD